MNQVAHTFFWAAARAMSRDLKVFVVSADAAQLTALLAAGAKEVITVAESAPEGVKARADYKERASSKDLVIDPEGLMPAEDLARLLKKKGAYLCGVARDLGDGFAATVAVRPQVRLTAKALLSIGEGEAERLGDLSGGAGGEGAGGEGAVGEGEPLFYVTAVSDLPALPALSATADAPATPQGEDPAALKAALEELKAELAKSERAKKAAQKAKAEAAEALRVVEGERDEARVALEEARTEGASLKRKVKAAETKSTAAAELTAELRATQSALEASLSAEQSRAATLEATGAEASRDLGAARAQLAEAQASLATLRAEASTLKDDLKGARRDAKLNAERRERAEQAEAALKDAQAAFERVTSAWSGWLARGLDGDLPPAPPARAALADAWAEQLLARQPLVSATREEHQELLALRVALRESEARERLLTEERDEARLALAAERRRGGVTDATLLATLEAERALRVAAERRLEEQAGQFERYEGELARLQGALDTARRSGSAAPSAAGAAGDRERQLRAELAAQAQQRAALERILVAQQALQAQLTQSLSAEISARSQAELARLSLEASTRALEVQLDPELRLPRPEPARPEPARPEPARRPEPPRVEPARRPEPPRVEPPRVEPARVEPPRRPEPPRPEPAARPTAERLGELRARLNEHAHAQEQAAAEAAHAPAPERAEVRLNPISASDRARLSEGAERLKAIARERAEGAPLPTPSVPPSAAPASPLEAMSDEERREHQARASALIKDRLASLKRRG